MNFQYLQFIEQLLVGKQLLRYNRQDHKLHIDMDWDKIEVGQYILVKCYMVVDPVAYPNLWRDPWLTQYVTTLIKRTWGNNLKKYEGMEMPGGLTFNGQKIYDEAVAELKELDAQLLDMYRMPPEDMVG
jgi:hypothetical protein